MKKKYELVEDKVETTDVNSIVDKKQEPSCILDEKHGEHLLRRKPALYFSREIDNGHFENFKRLINKLVEPELKRSYLLETINFQDRQDNLLHRVAFTGNIDMMRFLLEFNNNYLLSTINDANWTQSTPLHLAILNCHQDMIKLLIDFGADVTVKNNKGSLLEFAEYLKNEEHDPKIVLIREQIIACLRSKLPSLSVETSIQPQHEINKKLEISDEQSELTNICYENKTETEIKSASIKEKPYNSSNRYTTFAGSIKGWATVADLPYDQWTAALENLKRN